MHMIDVGGNRDFDRIFKKKDIERKSRAAKVKKPKKLTAAERTSLIKERFSLTHGGSKQNKKIKKRKGKK